MKQRIRFKRKIIDIVSSKAIDPFLIGLLGVIILAYFYQTPGLQAGLFSLSSLANYGVSLIFFLYGLKLTPEKLRAGLHNWKLHILIHAITFIAFPLFVLSAYPFIKSTVWETLWLGIFYLATLPGTVSSAVVMVSIAEGNIPAAIFNASISSFIGIFITPLWMAIFLSSAPEGFDLIQIIEKLALQVLIPVILGIVLNKKLGAVADKYKIHLKYFDQTIILTIVYISFCESFAKKMFQSLSLLHVFLLALLMLALFFIFYFILLFISSLLKFNREDRITALFCGSKKSLVQGTVMSKIIFSSIYPIGIILLPIMIYHALQLIVTSYLASYMRKKTTQVLI